MRIYASPFSSLSYQEFKTGYQLLKSIFKLLYNVYKEKNKPNYLKILEIHLWIGSSGSETIFRFAKQPFRTP